MQNSDKKRFKANIGISRQNARKVFGQRLKRDWYFAGKSIVMKQLPSYLRVALLAAVLASCQPTNNEKIEKDVQAGVALVDPAIEVSVADGVVTLSGTVKDSTTLTAAEAGVKEMKGVKSVINKLKVE